MKWIIRKTADRNHWVDNDGRNITPVTYIVSKVPDDYSVTDQGRLMFDTVEDAMEVIRADKGEHICEQQ